MMTARDPAVAGRVPVYHLDEVNHCPGCSRSNWFVGRITAECAFCTTAMPLADSNSSGTVLYRSGRPQ